MGLSNNLSDLLPQDAAEAEERIESSFELVMLLPIAIRAIIACYLLFTNTYRIECSALLWQYVFELVDVTGGTNKLRDAQPRSGCATSISTTTVVAGEEHTCHGGDDDLDA
jgi:hypothetical protein